MNMRAFRVPAIVLSASLAACGGGGTSSVPDQGSAKIRSGAFHVPVANLASTLSGTLTGAPGVTAYTLGDGGANSSIVFDLRFGADGRVYYALVPSFNTTYPTSGEVGSIDLTTASQSYQILPYAPGFVQETSDGSVWVEEVNNTSGNPTIDRYSGINGTDLQISVPKSQNWWNNSGFGNGIDGGIAVGPNGHVWFGSNNSAQVGEINPATNVVKLYSLSAPNDPWEPMPQYMMAGSDNHIWVTDAYNDGVFRVTSGGPSVGTNTFYQMPQGPWSSTNTVFLQGVVEGHDRKIYTGDPYPYAAGALSSAPIGVSPTFSSIALPATGISPFVLASAPGKIYFDDYRYSALGIYDTKTRHMVVLPLSPKAFGGIVVDALGTPWLGCTTNANVACIERVQIPQKWDVYPSRSITLYTSGPPNNESLPSGLIGIGEIGNSGPFRVVSSDYSICTASFVPGFDHNIQVNPLAAGNCTLTITDLHSRSVSVFVSVVNGYGNPDARVRGSYLTQIRPALRPRP